MIKIENVVLPSAEQWDAIIRGMRNPMNSWDKSDSHYGCSGIDCDECEYGDFDMSECPTWFMGDKDNVLAFKLANAGPVHAKYRRMIPVYLDVVAPLYWWKEFDTYKVGTVCNSCSTMHKIHEKEFTLDDFSCEHLLDTQKDVLETIVNGLNNMRYNFINYETLNTPCYVDKKDYWWQMIQLLPSSYNQRRTIMLNYEVLANIYEWRKDHKLDEWREFCKWIESLPYSELITGEKI
jgi:hypothetical protein